MGSRPVQPTAEYVLERLQEGNARFVRGRAFASAPGCGTRDDSRVDNFPFTTIFGCADSRTPPEHIFDLGLGDAFVVRTAGQVLDDGALGSLEYSITQFKTPMLIIWDISLAGLFRLPARRWNRGSFPAALLHE